MTPEEVSRFEAAKNKIIGQDRTRIGIGTLAEKTVHAVLKNYYAPDEEMHEIPIENCVADIYTGKEIVEIQTRSFDRMRSKLDRFLPQYPVTIVYPIPHIKTVYWIEEESSRYDRIPVSLEEEYEFTCPQDYLQLVPYGIPEPFTAAQFAREVHIRRNLAGTVLHILHYLGVVERDGKEGRAYLYRVKE